MTSTKRDLVEHVAENLRMQKSDVAKVVQSALDVVAESLGEGKRLEFRNFGVFDVKTRAARMGRNPRTGQSVPVPAKRTVVFRAGERLEKRVADSRDDMIAD